MKPDLDFDAEKPDSFKGWVADRLESLALTPKKLAEYSGLFLVLWVIYYNYFSALRSNSCVEIEINLALAPAIIKLLFCTGWPFAVVAFFDPAWRNKDAAHVAVAAYATYCIFVMHVGGCPFCILGSVTLFFPLIFSAYIMHTIGSWRHSGWFKK